MNISEQIQDMIQRVSVRENILLDCKYTQQIYRLYIFIKLMDYLRRLWESKSGQYKEQLAYVEKQLARYSFQGYQEIFRYLYISKNNKICKKVRQQIQYQIQLEIMAYATRIRQTALTFQQFQRQLQDFLSIEHMSVRTKEFLRLLRQRGVFVEQQDLRQIREDLFQFQRFQHMQQYINRQDRKRQDRDIDRDIDLDSMEELVGYNPEGQRRDNVRLLLQRQIKAQLAKESQKQNQIIIQQCRTLQRTLKQRGGLYKRDQLEMVQIIDNKQDVLGEVKRLFDMCISQFSIFESHIQQLNQHKEQNANKLDTLNLHLKKYKEQSQREINSLNMQLNTMKQQNRNQQLKRLRIQKQFNQSKEQLRKFVLQRFQQYKNQIKSLKIQNKSSRQQLQKHQKCLQTVKLENDKLANLLQSVSRSRRQSYTKQKQLQLQIVLAKKNLLKVLEQKENFATQKLRLQQIKHFELLLASQNIKIEDINQSLYRLTQQNEQFSKNQRQLILHIQQLKKQNEQSQKQLAKQTDKTAELTETVRRITQQNEQLAQKCRQLNLTIDQVLLDNTNTKILLDTQIAKTEEITVAACKLTQQNEQLITNNRQLNNQNEQLKQNNRSLLAKFNPRQRYQKFFPSQILQNLLDQKQWIINTIQKRYEGQVKCTRLLYKYDPANKTNLHHYIDHHPSIIAIAQLQNGRVVAAFSQSAFTAGSEGTDAILLAISERQSFFLKNHLNCGIVYDPSYLIFGNHQFRLKYCESKLFSRFAVGNSWFQSKGNSVDILFGLGKDCRQANLKTYSIYQVIFQQSKLQKRTNQSSREYINNTLIS